MFPSTALAHKCNTLSAKNQFEIRLLLKGEFEKAGIQSDDGVMGLVKDVRSEIEGL